MKKIETIWHFILNEALTQNVFRHTQQRLAQRLQYSLSTVHHALEIPSQMGAIRKAGKFFVLQDFKKLLYYWASIRKFSRDVLYSTAMDISVREIEGLAIPKSIYGTYSAGRHILNEPPADYSKVHFYIDPNDRAAFERRFPHSSKGPANTFALKMSPEMTPYGPFTTLVQTFVDIWNLDDWYAKSFTQALEERMHALLS